jgi:superoxide dismutase, Fe-Mn family
MTHTLPELPYATSALEPWIDEATVVLHHDKHHAGYVAGLNKAEAALASAVSNGNYNDVKSIMKELAFHGSGHILHSLYWRNMAPGAGGEPWGELSTRLNADFGAFGSFKSLFSATATAVEGSGWAVLAWDANNRRLVVLQAEKHQDLAQWGVTPLLVCDVWEHAYYLKYQNRRPEYVAGWWNVVNWADVAERFQAAGGRA